MQVKEALEFCKLSLIDNFDGCSKDWNTESNACFGVSDGNKYCV